MTINKNNYNQFFNITYIEMSIHTFGDSHAVEGWGDNVISHNI